jgi:SNF2 family DNA or RNA helicase
MEQISGDLQDADLAEIIPNVTDQGINLLEQEIEELESFLSDLKRIDEDPKIGQLIQDLGKLDREGHNRVIVFTQYTDTMDFIRNSLTSIHGSTVATYSGRGGEVYDPENEVWTIVGKERVKREFVADEGQVDILVCTDSASEGLNLQECGALINYDLPWNPMRVEQRIGRIDRIGQRYDEVTILNYSYEDTVETDIYDRLDDRIGLFENVVGEMQPILSGVSQQIRDATLKADRDEGQKPVEQADNQLSEQIKEQEQDDRVDVGESLDTLDSFVAQDVIDEAKLDAWESFEHTDIIDVGDTEYEYAAPYRTHSIQAVLVGNETLAEQGISFMSVTDVDIDSEDGEYADEFAFEDSTYRLSVDGVRINVPELEGEQTFAQAIAPSDQAHAVTFSAECANGYPSVHHQAPGNPLLGKLVTIILDASKEEERLVQQVETRSKRTDRPVVCGS